MEVRWQGGMGVRWQDEMEVYNCLDSTSIVLSSYLEGSYSRVHDVGSWDLLTWSFED